MNRKVRQLARKSVLSQKVSSDNLIVVQDFSLKTSKTKDFVKILDDLSLSDKKTAIMLGEVQENLHLSSRNVKGVIVFDAMTASTYDLLDCEKLVFDVDGIEKLNNQLSNN